MKPYKRLRYLKIMKWWDFKMLCRIVNQYKMIYHQYLWYNIGTILWEITMIRILRLFKHADVETFIKWHERMHLNKHKTYLICSPDTWRCHTWHVGYCYLTKIHMKIPKGFKMPEAYKVFGKLFSILIRDNLMIWVSLKLLESFQNK